jgi:DNA-binding response OmpR family regulator
LSPWRNLDDLLRLLVVDDDEVDRLAVRRHLAQAQVRYELDELAGGAELVERARAKPYDCIILDHSLPGEDGVALIERLQDAGVTTPILVLSGQDEEAGAELVAAGATDFLCKEDLSASRLLRRLRYVQRLSRAERGAVFARREAEADRRLVHAVLEHLPTGLVVIDDASGAITMHNPAAEAVFGPGCAVLKGAGEPAGAVEAPGSAAPPGGAAAVASISAEQAAARVAPLLAAALTSHASVTAEQPLEHHGRRYRVVATPLASPGAGAGGQGSGGNGRHGSSGGISLNGGGGGGGPARSVTVVTLDDITEELAAREAAERGVRARQDVLSIVSHDLRGPLSAIQVALDGLVDEQSSHAERMRYGAAVTRSVQRADRLVRDLMVAAQLDAGTLRMEWSQVSTRALLEQAVRDNEMLAVGAKVTLVLGPIDDVPLRTDRERLLQALANLVQNALRHGRGTPDVTLSARRRGDTIEISTRDRGPGIAAEVMPKLFQPFWQGSGRGGAGLGLAIVRGIARAHGGEVRVGEPEGKGAELVITLPLSAPEAPTPSAP